MAKYVIQEGADDRELAWMFEDPAGEFPESVEIPWWLSAKHEMVRRDIKNLNAELRERVRRGTQEEVTR